MTQGERMILADAIQANVEANQQIIILKRTIKLLVIANIGLIITIGMLIGGLYG